MVYQFCEVAKHEVFLSVVLGMKRVRVSVSCNFFCQYSVADNLAPFLSCFTADTKPYRHETGLHPVHTQVWRGIGVKTHPSTVSLQERQVR